MFSDLKWEVYVEREDIPKIAPHRVKKYLLFGHDFELILPMYIFHIYVISYFYIFTFQVVYLLHFSRIIFASVLIYRNLKLLIDHQNEFF